MAKFTKSSDAKSIGSEKILAKTAGGVAKRGKKQPAVAPAAAKPNAAVKAAIVADAKPKKAAPIKKETAVADPTRKGASKTGGHTVFLGNLPNSTKRKQIVNLFKPFGKTPSSVRFRRINGSTLLKEHRATADSIIAFVDLATAADASAAAKALNGTKLGVKVLRAEASTKNKSEVSKRTAFVGNLSCKSTDEVVRKAFEACGEIEYVRMKKNKRGKCNGTALVCFKEADSVAEALKLNGRDVNGRPVRISRSEKKQAEKAAEHPVLEESEESEEDVDEDAEVDESAAEETTPVSSPKVTAPKSKKK